jgi:hypothetical protein
MVEWAMVLNEAVMAVVFVGILATMLDLHEARHD